MVLPCLSISKTRISNSLNVIFKVEVALVSAGLLFDNPWSLNYEGNLLPADFVLLRGKNTFNSHPLYSAVLVLQGHSCFEVRNEFQRKCLLNLVWLSNIRSLKNISAVLTHKPRAPYFLLRIQKINSKVSSQTFPWNNKTCSAT